MTGQQPDIQWYIARDGKQHGPLSDVEMRTFVSQGHLKPTDLIWRPGFADWRPAPTVFSFQAPQAPEPPMAAPRSGVTRPTGPALRAASPAAERSFEPERIRVAQGDRASRPSRAARLAGIGLILVLLAGGGWFFFWHRGAPDNTPLETVEAPKSEQAPAASTQTAAQAPALPKVSQADVEKGAQSLDARFQRTPMWTIVKRDFPDWYNEQLKEAATLEAQNQPMVAVNKHLAEALVALRRQHAQEALAASTEKLKVVASAFLDNLKSLRKLGTGACFGFISQGETSPIVLEIMQSPDGASVQAQVAAIFEAIADGRKTPTQHEKAAKPDYEILVQELSKLGWKENDLKVFSNPQILSREPPERVCQMVQDWFTAHLAVADKATQERLLAETLKPVVSG